VTAPLQRPKRKNPVVKTRQPTLPPWTRSRVALGMTAAAAEGRLALQRCAGCGAVQYPPREACHQCLGIDLPWTPMDGSGELISQTTLLHSHDLYFRERVPWRLGMVKLDVGPTVVVHLHGDVIAPPQRIRVAARLDRAGMAVLVGLPLEETAHMADDRQLREFTADPKFRRVFVTDGKTATGQAVVRALVAAGADLVWVGHAEPWKLSPGLSALTTLPQVTLLPLDVTDLRSIKEVASQVGPKVDILINTAEYHRAYGIASRQGTDIARMEMDVNYLGLLRLAQEFGPVMKARGADGQSSAVAWVNLLSVFALSNFPAHGTYSASKAAALSLAQCLRAEMRPAGVRVVNVFPGPIDDEWNQLLPPPKMAPEAVAKAIVSALKDGLEDVYPGDVAQEWKTRLTESAKGFERELALGSGT
jgi:NAD(P)-dependent dehydrogenase (short-subunit alcohol dehydrogenase family)/uncharacterized OB-fold protein